MEIVKTQTQDQLDVKVSGRLDTSTAPQLSDELGTLDGVKNLVFDFADLEYVSSAGLRVLLASQKIMNVNGKMSLKNVNDSIMEVFEITGFSDIFTVEK
ncbi:MAG: STAS domain-containing protein [Bacillota bacterium]|nr:STAS domain-containing protein [Bacillota bacterium]